MNKKIEYLKKVAKPIKSKISLGKMNELNSLVEELRNSSENLREENDYTNESMGNAFSSLSAALDDVAMYMENFTNLKVSADEHHQIHRAASDLAEEIGNELEELGVERSPEYDDYIAEIIVGDEALRETLYDIDNEYIDISEIEKMLLNNL